LNEHKNSLLKEVKAFAAQLHQYRGKVYDDQADDLAERCQQLIANVESAPNEEQVVAYRAEMRIYQENLAQFLAQKRRDEAEKLRREEIARFQFELEEIERQLADITETGADKYDQTGRIEVKQALQALRAAIKASVPEECQAPSQAAHLALKQHQQRITEQRRIWEAQKATAEQAVGELSALFVGLQEDPVVMHWHGGQVQQLATILAQAEAAVRNEQFETPTAMLAQARQLEQQWVTEANAAQLQADQRDYIANAVAQSLAALGFFVAPVSAEDPVHPLSPMFIQARNALGQEINVSVPAEGDVWYDVNGFEMNVEPTVDGGTAPTCDAAEKVLEQLHAGLAQAFGVQMGEVLWDGKQDPDRILRRADALPSGESHAEREERR